MFGFNQVHRPMVAIGVSIAVMGGLVSLGSGLEQNLAARETNRSVLPSDRSFVRGPARLTQDKADVKKSGSKSTTIQDITLEIPAEWKQEDTAGNKMRLAQFKIPAAEGDKAPGELVISSFGGDGGGIDPNLKRWIDQFETKERKIKLSSGESAQGKYYVSDVSGTYLQSSGGPFSGGKKTPMPNYRSINVILVLADKGVYFLRLTGPEKTIGAVAESYRKTFGADFAKEADYEIK